MKWFVIFAVLLGGYYYFLTHTTDVILNQTQHLQQQYTYAIQNADQLAGVNSNR